MIAQEIIQVSSVLHVAQNAILVAISQNRIQTAIARTHRQTKRCHRINHDVKAQVYQFFFVQKAAFSELGHIGKNRYVQCPADRFEFTF